MSITNLSPAVFLVLERGNGGNNVKSQLGVEFGAVLFPFVTHVSSFLFRMTWSLAHCPNFGDHRP